MANRLCPHVRPPEVVSAHASVLGPGKAVGDPLGARWIRLDGAFGRSVVVLGMLYDMPDHCSVVTVEQARGGATATSAEHSTRTAPPYALPVIRLT